MILAVLLKFIGEYIYKLHKYISAKLENIRYHKKLRKQPGYKPKNWGDSKNKNKSKPVIPVHTECSCCGCWYSRKIGAEENNNNNNGRGNNSYEENEEEYRVYVRRQKRVVNFSDKTNNEYQKPPQTSSSRSSGKSGRTARFDKSGKNPLFPNENIEMVKVVTEPPRSTSSSSQKIVE